MLEEMASFFSSRLDGYDEHMLRDIYGAAEFYPFTASLLPLSLDRRILDLGSGTGLELEHYFRFGGCASFDCIDLSPDMLDAMISKFPGKDVNAVCGSYLELPLGSGVYDAAVSVESLHHFSETEKLSLYRKLHEALRPGGIFILTDYFASSDEEELSLAEQYESLRKEQDIPEGVLCHFDIPFTAEHEISVLEKAGFRCAEILRTWGPTATLRAIK